MSAIPKKRLTEQEYLERERNADFKSEFFRGEMFAMSGASYQHTQIKGNLEGELRSRLKSSNCAVHSSDLRVKVPATTLFTYPDVVVVCGKPEFVDSEFDTLLNPIVIIEVLSDSTEAYDRGDKFKNYRTIPSLQQVVLVSQKLALVESFERHPNNEWLLKTSEGFHQSVAFPSLNTDLPMSEIFAGVLFEDAAGVQRGQ